MARAIISAYYGRPDSFRYYDGCSAGGREALMLAQRYPRDFNGIIAGAPASNMAPVSTLFTGTSADIAPMTGDRAARLCCGW